MENLNIGVNKKKLLLFDLDKTLSDVGDYTDNVLRKIINSENNLDEIMEQSCLNNATKENNFFKEFIEEFRAPIREGGKIQKRLIDILGEKNGALIFDKFKKLKNEPEMKKELKLFPKINELLYNLKNDEKSIIGIVTNKEKDIALKELDYLGIKNCFDRNLILTSSDVEKQKPDTDMLELISLRAKLGLGENFGKIYMIGDSQADINGANNLKNKFKFAENIQPILVSYSHSNNTLEKQKKEINGKKGVDYTIVNTVEELNNIIKTN